MPKRIKAFNGIETWELTEEETRIVLDALGAMAYEDEEVAEVSAAFSDAYVSRKTPVEHPKTKKGQDSV